MSSGGLSGDKPRHNRGHGRQRRAHRRFALFGSVGEALGRTISISSMPMKPRIVRRYVSWKSWAACGVPGA
jgi:hypothetical protein